MDGKLDLSKCVFAGQLKVLWELGQGSHGEVLLVEDSSSEEFGVKTVPGYSSTVKLLQHEYKVYRHLQCHKKKIPGLPQVFKYGFDHLHDKYVLVMSRLGASMRDVMKLNRAPIPEYAALRIGCQLIRRLQYVHSMGLVHCDIKPRNILCGHETFEKVYLVDFGLATFYKSMKSGRHRRMMTGQRFKGTEDFASRNAHNGFSLSRRDDLESLGFTLIYMMRGSLPWSKTILHERHSWRGFVEEEEEPVPEIANMTSNERVNAKTMKENTSIETLCEGLPDCMSIYMRYVYGLTFDEAPDYSLLITTMEERMDQLKRIGGEDNGNELEIWTVPFERSLYMRIREEKELWANFALEKDDEEEEEDGMEDIRDIINNVRNGHDAIEEPRSNADNEVSCNPFRCLRASRKKQISTDDDSKEGSEVSSVQPHPVLFRNSLKLWNSLLVFFRIQKPIPKTVVLHYSDEGFYSEAEREW